MWNKALDNLVETNHILALFFDFEWDLAGDVFLEMLQMGKSGGKVLRNFFHFEEDE